ncbi:hypothetical protein N7495_005785 [Penicillium taxi]|uniref:uncharacterized protein n=1 Tax=Penicillium taxi TaxID=168475 RepID=UPI0025459ECC|nr:uncharacterized protein N7495_005785 [Penicillium taxi]KAJ5894094.1 hypothetical protein N7495_005785 [Penicillium taxi]
MDYKGRAIEPMHIDRKSLYVNLESRIKYLHHFLEWTSADVEALQSGAKYLKQLIPAVVNLVYKKLLVYDITSRSFHTRNTADERDPDKEWLTEETPQIMRRKMFLRWYLTRLCQDPSTMEFWRYLDKVGVMHSGAERLHALNIEYIHMGACLGYIQDIFTEALMSHPQLSMRRKLALVRAINKIIWIQNDLFAKYHCRNGEEYADEMSLYTIGSEGYIGDKKILGSSSSSSEDDRSSVHSTEAPSIAPSTAPSTIPPHGLEIPASLRAPGSPSTGACPFASMAGPSTTETKIWSGNN